MTQRQRFMRAIAPDTFDIVISTWVGTAGEGYWSETRWGQIRQDADGYWRADYMVGENPQKYPIPGAWPVASEAAVAVDEYSLEQARIGQAQYAYERANGWSTD
jgi:hypothetical protein